MCTGMRERGQPSGNLAIVLEERLGVLRNTSLYDAYQPEQHLFDMATAIFQHFSKYPRSQSLQLSAMAWPLAPELTGQCHDILNGHPACQDEGNKAWHGEPLCPIPGIRCEMNTTR